MDSPDPDPIPSATSRRRFLAGAAAGAGGLAIAGAWPQHAAAGVTSIDHAFAGVAAFVAPGNDAFSRHQGVRTDQPGGVDAQAGRVVIETLDAALPLVLGEAEVRAPGALGVAILLDTLAVQRRALSVIGPFASPFANLKYLEKRWVLEQLDLSPLLNGTPLEYGGNAITTLAAMGAFSERASFDRRAGVLTSRPKAWDRSQYGGVSDGWPEFIGYYQDRTEVTG